MDKLYMSLATAQDPRVIKEHARAWQAAIDARDATELAHAEKHAAFVKAWRDKKERFAKKFQEVKKDATVREVYQARQDWLNGPRLSSYDAPPYPHVAPSAPRPAVSSASVPAPAPAPAPEAKAKGKAKPKKTTTRKAIKEKVVQLIVSHAFPLNKFEFKTRDECTALPSKSKPYAISRKELLERIASDAQLRALFPGNVKSLTKEELCDRLFKYRGEASASKN